MLATLPYDIVLLLVSHLHAEDTLALSQCCQTIRSHIYTKPVFRLLALGLLRRCRPLPIASWDRLQDLSLDQLIPMVTSALRWERHDHRRPLPLNPTFRPSPYLVGCDKASWYRYIKVDLDPDDVLDWLSPVTTRYTLAATRAGRVICSDTWLGRQCVASWMPPSECSTSSSNGSNKNDWVLWKCRVQHGERTVYFIMGSTLVPREDDDRQTRFLVIRLKFPPDDSSDPPVFEQMSEFTLRGIVTNLFLLDPENRFIAGFTWIVRTHTLGLFLLPDWDLGSSVFLDTRMPSHFCATYTAIHHTGLDAFVIHCEDSEAHAVKQHFYSMRVLREYCYSDINANIMYHTYGPIHAGWLEPCVTMIYHPSKATKSFTGSGLASGRAMLASSVTDDDVYSTLGTVDDQSTVHEHDTDTESESEAGGELAEELHHHHHHPIGGPNSTVPNYLPESPHFVRQWWPVFPLDMSSSPMQEHTKISRLGRDPEGSMVGVGVGAASSPRLSCTTILFSQHICHPEDDTPRPERFINVIGQHYFGVPMTLDSGSDMTLRKSLDSCPSLRIWFKHDTVADSGGHDVYSLEERAMFSGVAVWGGHKPQEVNVLDGDYDGDWVKSLLQWSFVEPFEVVRVFSSEDASDPDDEGRGRPLIAVDFGHAAWVEYIPNVESEDEDEEEDIAATITAEEAFPDGLEDPLADLAPVGFKRRPKRIRFVTFPPIPGSQEEREDMYTKLPLTMGEVFTLDVPAGLDLDLVETINFDQSQCAVVLSTRRGGYDRDGEQDPEKVWFLCYE